MIINSNTEVVQENREKQNHENAKAYIIFATKKGSTIASRLTFSRKGGALPRYERKFAFAPLFRLKSFKKILKKFRRN